MALEVDVPSSVRAEVALPGAGRVEYAATGEGAPRFVGVRGHAIFEVGSGRSRFVPAVASAGEEMAARERTTRGQP